jgi:hypothetical protein
MSECKRCFLQTSADHTPGDCISALRRRVREMAATIDRQAETLIELRQRDAFYRMRHREQKEQPTKPSRVIVHDGYHTNTVDLTPGTVTYTNAASCGDNWFISMQPKGGVQ